MPPSLPIDKAISIMELVYCFTLCCNYIDILIMIKDRVGIFVSSFSFIW